MTLGLYALLAVMTPPAPPAAADALCVASALEWRQAEAQREVKARTPGLYLQGDRERPRGHVEAPSTGRLLEIMGDRRADTAERVAAMEMLAYLGRSPLPLEPVLAMKRLARGDSRVDYLHCLGLCGEAGLEELSDYSRRRKPAERAEYVYAWGRHAEDGEEVARATLADRDEAPEARVAALRALADRGSDFAVPEALRRLAMEDGVLLLEALAVLRREPSHDAVSALIQVVDEHEGRPAREAVALLQKITGYNIGMDVRRWKYFFLRHKAEGTPMVAESSEEPNSPETLSYLGLPIYGDRVVFVLDASGSMNDPMPEQWRSSRAERAVQEFVQLLPRLPEAAAFNVVYFASGVNPWSERLRAQDQEAVAEASGWAQRQPIDGGTNLYGGVAFAFNDPEVQEIVLLSDGRPTHGELIDSATILARVARWNRWRGVRISTVSLGAMPEPRAFLYRLSRENGGACRVIN